MPLWVKDPKLLLLLEIAEGIGDGNGDTEIEHSMADDSLCAAIKLLADGTEYEKVANEIVAKFEAMMKWYA